MQALYSGQPRRKWGAEMQAVYSDRPRRKLGAKMQAEGCSERRAGLRRIRTQ
jgi:hypothetical protein